MKEFILLTALTSFIFSGVFTFGFFEIIDYIARKRQGDFNKNMGSEATWN